MSGLSAADEANAILAARAKAERWKKEGIHCPITRWEREAMLDTKPWDDLSAKGIANAKARGWGPGKRGEPQKELRR